MPCGTCGKSGVFMSFIQYANSSKYNSFDELYFLVILNDNNFADNRLDKNLSWIYYCIAILNFGFKNRIV